MSTPPIPAYPVVYVDVASDGSAHVNVAGRHENFKPAPNDVTRRAVTAYAAAVAAELRRPVRTQITDPDGQWFVAVHPTGAVTDLEAAPQKATRPRVQNVTMPVRQSSRGADSVPVDPPPATTPAPTLYRPPARATPSIAPPPVPKPATAHELDQPQLAPQPQPPTATLHFSTGDIAHITGVALIGRRPVAEAGENIDIAVAVNDASHMLSRTHLRIEWHDGALWATDRSSANGTTIQRHGGGVMGLTPWRPFQLRDRDVALLGDVRVTVHFDEHSSEVTL